MEITVLALFCAALLVCVVFNFSVLYALLFGLLLFSFYALIKGFSLSEIGKMILHGIGEAKNVLFALLLIGMLTATWRACGTIAGIICYSSPLVGDKSFIMLCFILCCLISLLTGTAFGSAGTMGVICMTMGLTKGLPPILLGGAILSGCYFGDRCSPVSTSLLLVSQLTETDMFRNIKSFFKSAAIPFVVTCLIYLLLGFLYAEESERMDLFALFGQELNINIITLLPALIIVIWALCRQNVKFTMAAGILSAAAICVFVQGISVKEVLHLAVHGYHAADSEVAVLLDGGGIVSMLKVIAIIGISSGFAGIFDKTGMLASIQNILDILSHKIGPFSGLVITSVISAMVACNQTLGIILSHQLYGRVYRDKEKMALALADSIVVITPLIPWTTACVAPMTTIDGPTGSILAACYLYLLPLWGVIREQIKRRSQKA